MCKGEEGMKLGDIIRNKSRWMNFVFGILLMIAGSLDKSLIIMFIGFFLIFSCGVHWSKKIINKNKIHDLCVKEKIE